MQKDQSQGFRICDPTAAAGGWEGYLFAQGLNVFLCLRDCVKGDLVAVQYVILWDQRLAWSVMYYDFFVVTLIRVRKYDSGWFYRRDGPAGIDTYCDSQL